MLNDIAAHCGVTLCAEDEETSDIIIEVKVNSKEECSQGTFF